MKVVELAEPGKAVRAQDRPGRVALRQWLSPWQRRQAIRQAIDLRHDVVVVRVEPLRHLPRLALRRPAGEGGQEIERRIREALRVNAEHERRLEHLVIQEEIVNGGADQVALLSEVGGTELGHAGVELRGHRASGPCLLERPFELAVWPDAWVSDQLRDDVQGRVLCGMRCEV